MVFNDKRFGCVYSLKASLSGVPDIFRYHLSHRIRRMVGSENTSSPWQQIAREVKAPRERLEVCAGNGIAGDRTERPVLVRQSASGGGYSEAKRQQT